VSEDVPGPGRGGAEGRHQDRGPERPEPPNTRGGFGAGTGLAIGAGIGAAVGAAINQITLWLPIGIAVGLVVRVSGHGPRHPWPIHRFRASGATIRQVLA
jgi:hypothetical protein